jgi:hypothetical protein
VVQACKDRKFSVYAIHTVDEAITLLTGRAAGSRGPHNRYAEGSVNFAVEARLARFAAARTAMATGSREAQKP